MNEILSFLLPQLNDGLQIAFFAIILTMIGATVASAHKTARPASWEHKWNRGTPDDPSDDLDIEHGSVTDLWHAVATAPEKLAEVMPGLLLVVGLLGTFLGLGLALNHASSILGQADLTNAGAAADSMQNLLGLLQGLGTKFKTSTWGILGFVSLKIWSEVTRFEEKRLAWVIGKVKAELESRKRQLLAAAGAKQDALFGSIGLAASGVVDGMGSQFKGLIASNEAMHQQAMAQLATLAQGSDGVRSDLEQLKTEFAATRSTMVQFTESTQHVVTGMGEAAQRMAAGADKVGAGAEQLVGAIGVFESQFTAVLDKVGADLGKAVEDMSAQAAATLERGANQLGDATREISTALGNLSADTKETMNEVKQAISHSLTIQEKASIAFTTSSHALNANIAETTGIVSAMSNSITEGLESIGNAILQSKKVAEAVKKSSDNLETVVAELRAVPGVLAPLQGWVEEQKAAVAALAPLAGIVQVQHTTLMLLQAMQAEAKAPLAAAASATEPA